MTVKSRTDQYTSVGNRFLQEDAETGIALLLISDQQQTREREIHLTNAPQFDKTIITPTGKLCGIQSREINRPSSLLVLVVFRKCLTCTDIP